MTMSSPRDTREIIREEQLMRARILGLVRRQALTIPEIAETLGCPTSEVTYWVMGLRKYGHLVEEKEVTDEGYYRYGAVAKQGQAEGEARAESEGQAKEDQVEAEQP